MSRVASLAGPLVALVLVSAMSRAAAAQVRDSSTFVRAQQMVTAGQGDAGRAVVDSVLAVTPPESPRYAEALFWRATLARSAADAERDYRRISVEYPLSSRAPEALLRLAQLEMARGDRGSARAHLERLQREHPTGATSTRASVWLARLAFDDGDTAQACAAVAAARGGIRPGDVELRNQLDYYAPRCAAAGARAADSARGDATAGDSTADAASTSTEYSVQVAAYAARADAAALAGRLSARGFSARVVGDVAPYRVRVGRYPTRARAEEALRRMRAASVRGVIVEAERR